MYFSKTTVYHIPIPHPRVLLSSFAQFHETKYELSMNMKLSMNKYEQHGVQKQLPFWPGYTVLRSLWRTGL